MHIKRMEVESGFLGGFDVEFEPGLNVIIGARGTGKTSILELMRYVTGAKNHTPESAKRSLAHAHSIIGEGDVELLLDDDLFGDIHLARSRDDSEPRGGIFHAIPLMFSQTEIETMGLSAAGRLQLLDRFVESFHEINSDEAGAVSAIKSISKEIETLRFDVGILQEGIEELPSIQAQISALQEKEKELRDQTKITPELQGRTESLSNFSGTLSVKNDVVQRFASIAERWADVLTEMVKNDYGVEVVGLPEDEDPLSPFRAPYQAAIAQIEAARDEFHHLARVAKNLGPSLESRKIEVDSQIRKLRMEIEALSEGAGTLSRNLQTLRTKQLKINSQLSLVQDRRARLAELYRQREHHIRRLDKARKARSDARADAARQLNLALNPQIKIEVERFGQYDEYVAAIIECFRGSGLKYNEVAASIAENLSPPELVSLVEDGNFEGLGDAVGLSRERAFRLVSHMKETNLGDILAARIEDSVQLLLLDGLEYKSVEMLSAGQRCTVVLSVVLQLSGTPLIIDQPEDHLDNAYVASTVIRALIKRKKDTQVILTTHNANIPVLAQADLVIEMSSDGRNGFVQVCKPLDHPEAVEAITKVMEGGQQAFDSRAAFYESNKWIKQKL